LSLLIGCSIVAQPRVFAAGEQLLEHADQHLLLNAMKTEMKRSLDQLKTAGDAPLYFLAYRANEGTWIDIQAENGALAAKTQPSVWRTFYVEARVGSPEFDNTHNRSNGWAWDEWTKLGNDSTVPIENDELGIRNTLWVLTDKVYKDAEKHYALAKANKSVDVADEDASNDFSLQPPRQFNQKEQSFNIDQPKLEELARQWSKRFRNYPFITRSSISLNLRYEAIHYINSEGTVVEENRPEYWIDIHATTKLEDGMDIWLYEDVVADSPDELASNTQVNEKIDKLAKSLDQLRTAPAAEPYSGPAILKGKAAAVFFHEIFGHRIEGHRQKNENEGRTFARRLGTKVMPSFISVVDDPTLSEYHGRKLNGFYSYDDEGVPAQKAVLVDHGILKGFLMGRSPVQGFPSSNGHGRCAYGASPVARQANLMVLVDPKKQVSEQKLRAELLAQIKKQHKPYGLIFDELAGGSTNTSIFSWQAFTLEPLRVTRVFADGRPDELLRGVDIVGTPLASLERILSAGTDVQTFNGRCGAESGWIPVSASSPSLLVQTIEVQRKWKSPTKPPLLPPPDRISDR
jgi:predicted Zn-dependent protease